MARSSVAPNGASPADASLEYLIEQPVPIEDRAAVRALDESDIMVPRQPVHG